MSSSMLENLSSTLKLWEKEPLLKFLSPLQQHLPTARIYLVGGAVRDALIGKAKQKDFDVVVQGVDAKTLEQVLSSMGRVDLVGKTFGVFKFRAAKSHSKEVVDIALPRREHAFGTGGYREVDVQSDPTLPIEKDLERRDFTINAIAVEVTPGVPLGQGRLVDPYKGFDDLRDRILRTVGTPSVRFQEDYSRLLRALRFTCQLNLTIEPSTWKALIEYIPHLNEMNVDAIDDQDRKVPYEIISKEFLKSFWWNPVRAFDLYEESGAFNELIPELLPMKGCPHPPSYHSEGDVWAHTRLALQKLTSHEFRKEFPDDPITMETILGTLFHDIGKPAALTTPELHGTDRYRYHGHDKIGGDMAEVICTRLKLSSQPKESEFHISCDGLGWIVSKHLILLNSKLEEMRSSTIEKYFFNPRVPGITLLQVIFADSVATIPEGGEPVMDHFRIMKRRIGELLKLSDDEGSLRRRGLPHPLLSGDAVMEHFRLQSGPKIGKLLRIVREQQLQGKIHTAEQALTLIQHTLKAESTHQEHHAPSNPTLPL